MRLMNSTQVFDKGGALYDKTVNHCMLNPVICYSGSVYLL